MSGAHLWIPVAAGCRAALLLPYPLLAGSRIVLQFSDTMEIMQIMITPRAEQRKGQKQFSPCLFPLVPPGPLRLKAAILFCPLSYPDGLCFPRGVQQFLNKIPGFILLVLCGLWRQVSRREPAFQVNVFQTRRHFSYF